MVTPDTTLIFRRTVSSGVFENPPKPFLTMRCSPSRGSRRRLRRIERADHHSGRVSAGTKSEAKFRGSIENLICEMDKMLCRHRKTGVASICGQVDQPFGQGEWASERA